MSSKTYGSASNDDQTSSSIPFCSSTKTSSQLLKDRLKRAVKAFAKGNTETYLPSSISGMSLICSKDSTNRLVDEDNLKLSPITHPNSLHPLKKLLLLNYIL